MAQNGNVSNSSSVTLQSLVKMVIRMYALYLLLSSFIYAINYAAFFLSMEWKTLPGNNPYLSSLSFFIGTGTALLLLFKSQAIADIILSGQDDSRIEWNISASDLVALALTVIGISFLVSGLQGLSALGVRWLLSPEDEMTGMRAHLDQDITLTTGSTVQFLAGIVLIIGFKRFALWFNRARAFFSLKDDSLPSSEEKPEDSSGKEDAQKLER